MADPASRLATRVAYGASQLPRVAWYVGHALVMRRLSEEARRRAGDSSRPRAHTDAPVPDRKRLYADMATLFRQDLANVERGIYPLPADHDGSLPTLLERSRLFFEGSAGRPSPPREPAAPGSAERADARQAAELLSAELPFPVGRLDDGGFGAPLRYPGRGAVQRHGQCHAAAGAGAAARGFRRPRPAPPAGARRRLRHRALPRLLQAGLAAPAGARARHVGDLYRRGQAPSRALVLDQPRGRKGGGHCGARAKARMR